MKKEKKQEKIRQIMIKIGRKKKLFCGLKD